VSQTRRGADWILGKRNLPTSSSRNAASKNVRLAVA